MTVVKNRLVYPDGTAHAGQRIVATLMSGPNWLEGPDEGRALGWVETYTDQGGLWSLDLMPYTQVEPPADEDMYYRVDEGEQQWNIRVPPFNDGGSLWLKDLVIDPPPPRRQTWRLGGLEDVSNQRPADGEILVYQGGQWVPSDLPVPTTELAALTDVDGATLPTAAIGTPLSYLGGGMWGVLVDDDDPTTASLTFYADYDPDDPEGRTIAVELRSRAEGAEVVIDWDDGSDTTLLDPDTNTASHRYRAGTYELYIAYADGSEEGQPVLGSQDVVVIPNPNLEATHTMTTTAETAEPDARPSAPRIAFRQVSTEQLRATCRMSGHTGRWVLHWGDGEQKLMSSGTSAAKSQPYPGPGPYTLVAVEYGNTSNVLARHTVFLRDAETGFGATIEPDPDHPQAARVVFPPDPDGVQHAAGRVRVFWDFDDTETQPEQVWTTPGTSVTHVYDEPGDYRVRLWDPDTGLTHTETVTVVGQQHDPDGTFTQNATDDPWTVKFTLTRVGIADTDIWVDWGTGDEQDVTRMQNPKPGDSVTFTYPSAAPEEQGGVWMPLAYYDGWPAGADPVAGVVEVPFA